MVVLALYCALAQVGSGILLDPMEAVGRWKAVTSLGTALNLSTGPGKNGQALVFDYDFQGKGGFALAELPASLDLKGNFELSFWLKADSPDNNFEFKFMDPSGESVWWIQRSAYEWPKGWRRMVFKRRHVRFAWGPKPSELSQVGSIQFGVAANAGGKGKVWIDDLEIRPLPDSRPFQESFTISDAKSTNVPLLNPVGAYASPSGSVRSEIILNLPYSQEMGGLRLAWKEGLHAAKTRVQWLQPGGEWSAPVAAAYHGGGVQYIPLPLVEAEKLKLSFEASASEKFSVEKIQLLPPEFEEDANYRLKVLAKESTYTSKILRGEQSYWTVFGPAGGMDEGLINEEGLVEFGRGLPSVESTLVLDGKPQARAFVPSLMNGSLPIPQLFQGGPVSLEIVPLKPSDRQPVAVRYRLRNTTSTRQKGELILAMRPSQTNPAWQNLGIRGGFSRVGRAHAELDRWTYGPLRLTPSEPATRYWTSSFMQGDPVIEVINGGGAPDSGVDDPQEMASLAAAYAFDLAPGETKGIVLTSGNEAMSSNDFQAMLEEEKSRWEGHLGEPVFQVPGDWGEHYRANLGYILINEDGPLLQPGSRVYERSWMRDGSLTGTALLHAGQFERVKAFIQAFAPHIRPDGYVPCVVDRRGPDPVPEHDSHGQFIYLVAEYLRMTGDLKFAQQMYPDVVKVAGFLDSMRAARSTPEFTKAKDERRRFAGLLLPSISHEGYAQPKHSYWDVFFGIRGYEDAAFLARTLGKAGDAKAFTAKAKSLRQAMTTSMRLTSQAFGVNYVPGCAELGDFDATSTSIGISPVNEIAALPADLLQGTYDRYAMFVRDRISGLDDWNAYTPYEWRNVTAMLMLGRRDDAITLMDFLASHSRPKGWRHWAEVVRRDPLEPSFIGDMPHTWCGSEFMRALRTCFIFEDGPELARRLVVGAGLRTEWFEGNGFQAGPLRTHFGTLHMSGVRQSNRLVIKLSGQATAKQIALRIPKGMTKATSEGKLLPEKQGMIVVPTLPATVEFEP